jgi:murein DD-endopeptidase MepM/ murein hydrolase activator NlpD
VKRRFSLCIALAFAVWVVATTMIAPLQAESIRLVLPTPNTAIHSGNGPAFYMYVDRNTGGVKSTPWQGGQYGYVRTPTTIGGRTVYKRFHEGIDIAPVGRDASGNPTDSVGAISDGRVVHANDTASHSNYGRYVVVEHRWGGCPYYSLYAHLNAIAVKPGDRVRMGETLGRLGFTGRGIDKRRAHLHLEIDLLLSEDFENWHRLVYPRDINRHGLYNGLNLAGIDVAAFYLAHRKDPDLTLAAFLGRTEPAFTVVIPDSKEFTLAKRYPWMLGGASGGGARAWRITFGASGVPFKIEPLETPVQSPRLVWVKPSSVGYRYTTKDYVTGSGSSPTLSDAGKGLMHLLSPVGFP